MPLVYELLCLASSIFVILHARALREGWNFVNFDIILLGEPARECARMALRPKTDEDWEILREEISTTFSPGAPIRERDLLAGRLDQIALLLDAVRQPGKHAVMFGERGVGKTSLANTFALGINSPTRSVLGVKVNCDPKETFSSLWKKVFKRIAYGISTEEGDVRRFVSDDYDANISPDDVQIELSNFSQNTTPIIVIDEFDRVQDKDVPLLISDTIKALSDYVVNCTLIIVGVAEDISSLISNHQSISRQIIQVRMPRMSRTELAKIITDRVNRLGMRVDDEVLWRITFLSRGLPYFTHLLAMHTARAAVDARKTIITDTHLNDGITSALREVDQSLKDTYGKAIESKKPKSETLYEPVLLACAIADSDDMGKFQQKDVEQPLASVLDGKSYKATTYAFHMNEFCQERRCQVLENTGGEQVPRYRFKDPMMQPYVILRGLAEGRLTSKEWTEFIPQRQPRLSTDF